MKELNNQNQQVNPTSQPSQSISTTNPKSKLLIILSILLLSLIVGNGAYYLGLNSKRSTIETNQNYSPITPSLEPTTQVSKSPLKSLSPDNYDTVSYGYQNAQLLMHYRNKVYSYDEINKKMVKPIPESQYSNVTWYGLLQAPQSVNDALIKHKGYGHDEIFDLRPLSDNNFVFIMRWDKIASDNGSNWELPIYYFHANNQSLELLASYLWPNDKETSVPRFNSMSPNGKYLAFNMYGCWNCDAGYPEIMLMNINTKATKRLGKIFEFTWKENDSYAYKEYKEIPCPDEPRGQDPCLEDPTTLPLKNDSFQ